MIGGFLFLILYGILSWRFLSSRLGARVGTSELTLLSALVTGVTIVISIELLNAFQQLNSRSTILFWVVACLAMLVLGRKSRLGFSFVPDFQRLRIELRDTESECRLLFLAIYFLGTFLGVMAVFAVPNNWDSMCYHLTRVAFWREYGSISFFATNNPRQNNLSPFCEWTILQLSLLQGQIALANLVQWLSYLGCILGVSEICRLLGGQTRECLVSAFLCATLPMAILQATSTQNDMVAGFWLILAVYGCVKMSLGANWLNAVIFGLALGLALLTKTVIAIYAGPFLAWAGWVLIRLGWRPFAGRFILIGALIIGLNSGHFLRNIETSGAPFGPNGKSGTEYTNETHSPSAIFSNIVRNMALHAQFLQEKAASTSSLVIKIHQWMGLDPYDPRTSWNTPKGSAFVNAAAENCCPMPMHLGLTLISAFFISFFFRSRYAFSYHALLCCVLVGAFLFCFVLKWQVWHSRLQLPLFIVATPFCAAFLDREWSAIRRWTLLLVVFLLAMPHVFSNPYRPAFGVDSIFTASADEQRFRVRPPYKEPYEECFRILHDTGARTVGVIADDSNEYPLFDPFFDGTIPPYIIHHVNVEGIYARFQKDITPDAVVCFDMAPQPSVVIRGKVFENVYRAYDSGTGLFALAVFLPPKQTPHAPNL